ncbi:hypothetical protein SNE35_28815 [Paucibacter sp. R3-3]|uniref:Response regulatory domain-containing protein n=1 Tax=Roseateles agri TaxID=3098619 RepID=A0ABU5DQC5_9BURK|nr:hypothetical protein [Paucibacter sp. R3-3]MDY0748537.1 hypothetical protein [Paucibacter sp. R3-3]
MSTPSPAPSAAAAANDAAQGSGQLQWADIVQQLGAEIAGPLSTALERIHSLINTGQIDRQSLRALRESVSQAREAGMVGQQLARLASGRLRLSRERLHLTQLLRGVLAHRSRETQARGVQVRQMLKPVEVIADGALMFSLLNALMDWALAGTHSSIDLRLDLTPWPVKARLVCRFANRALDMADDPYAADASQSAGLNSLAWRLVEQTALTMGVQPVREDEHGITVLILEFAHPVSDEPGFSDAQPDLDALAGAPNTLPLETHQHSGNSKPLAGSHLLIVTGSRELQQQILAAVAHMGLIIDLVTSAEEAATFCQDGLPHGILFDTAQRGPALDTLRAGVLREVPNFSFVEVLDGDQAMLPSSASADGLGRIARRDLAELLPSMLLFEMARGI